MTAASPAPRFDLPASSDDDTVTKPDTLWRRYRPVAIAMPLFMLASYVSWRRDSPPDVAHISLLVWLLLCLAGATPPVTTFAVALRLSDRRPLAGELSWRNLGVHVLAVLVCLAVDLLVRVIVIPLSPIPVPPYGVMSLLINTGVAYTAFWLGCQGFRTARDAKKAEAARAKLRADLVEARRWRAEAELRALKAELNPHFLGNALQGVKGLMRTDVHAAQGVLASIGDLLRTTLTRANTPETTLREEIEALRPFIVVERARLRGRVEVEFEIDGSTLDLLVPDMILQPLVENAVKHGLVPFGGGRIRIAARRASDGSSLELVVEDDGVALGSVGTTRASKRGGVGLANIRARLAELYGSHASLELARGGLGTVVRITLPLRDADTADPLSLEPDETATAAAAPGRASVPRFADDTWSGRAWRVFAMVATIGLWFFWTMNNVAGNARSAVAKGYDDKQLYSIVDGIVVGSLMVAMVHFAFWLSRRMQVTAEGADRVLTSARAVLVSIVVGTASAAAICFAKVGIAAAFHYSELLEASHLQRNIPRSMIGLVVIFLVACVAAQSYHAVRRSQAARRLRRRLRAELDDTRRRRSEAELRALKSELNPHFIGNALNALSVLMRTDTSAAARVIDQLSDLLRTAVDRAATQEVSLREELESLQPFLAVERIRLGRNLDISLDVDEETLDGRVPHLILQTLVENAVKHGFALRNRGLVEVHAHRDDRHLELTICDDGAGLSSATAAPARRGGTGLANVRARLAKLYGTSASLELSSVPDGGTVARLLIPWHDTDGFTPAQVEDALAARAGSHAG